MTETATLSTKEVLGLLQRAYGEVQWRPRYDAVSELIFTILSQHTSDVNAKRAFDSLRKTFGSWEVVAQADVEAIEAAIRTAGLSRIKAPRIKEALQEIRRRRQRLDLDFLKSLPLAEAKAWLRSLPGIGPKSAAVILCFSLGMPALPVDTHVYRVARRLGLVDSRTSPEEAHEVLERMVEPAEVYPFHVFLITHGRRVCKAPRPLCQRCTLEPYCPSSLLKDQEKTYG